MEYAEIIDWPSGESRPVLATRISPAALHARCEFKIFRDKDDLDWFTGGVVDNDFLKPLLIMKHDGNPLNLTAFYVDSLFDIFCAQSLIISIFQLQEDEINWRLTSDMK